MDIRRRLCCPVAFFLLCGVSFGNTAPSASSYAVHVSTTSARARRRRPRRHTFRAVQSRIEGAIKKTSPNLGVRGSSTQALPPQAPTLLKVESSPAVSGASAVDRFFAAAAKVMTKTWGSNIFVWLPAISTDPNAGPTFGILPVWVMADPASHHIRDLVAPSYTYNSLFGQTGTARYYFYPTDASQLYANASISQHTNHELKARYQNTAARAGIFYIDAEAYNSVDGSPRFYGIGPQTHHGDETGYVARDSVVRGDVGINFLEAWRATVGGRFRHFTTGANIIPDTADLTTRFPSLEGTGTDDTVAGQVRLLWDTRDSPVTPSQGSSGELFVENTSGALGSDSHFFRYGLEGRRLFAWKNPRQTTVVHSLYEQVNGPNVPFYELPSLGGRETLRGYGEGRLTDRGRLVFNVEQRMVVSSLDMMGIQTNFEVAPFFDLGTVFASLSQARRQDFRPVAGGAFRAVVKPNVVGDVEVGFGKEGPAVFVDINYPY